MLDQLITPLSNPVIIAGYSYTILNTLQQFAHLHNYLFSHWCILNPLVHRNETQIYFEVFMAF